MTVRTLTGDRASIVTSYKLSMKTHSQKINFELKCNIPFEGRCCTSIIKQTDQILNTVSTHAGTVSMKRQTPCRKLPTDEVMQPAGNNRFGKGARCGLGREHSRAGCGLGRGHSRAGCGLGRVHSRAGCGLGRGQAVIWEGGRLWSGKGAGCGLGRGHAVVWEGGTQWLDVGRSSFVTRLKAQTPSTLF